MLRDLGLKDDADVMRWLLHGELGSRTGQPARGKGLPKIHKWSTQGRIRSLVIVSNFVYANVEAEHYRLMSHSFEGTLLYLEVKP